jgi:hypothetical protein
MTRFSVIIGFIAFVGSSAVAAQHTGKMPDKETIEKLTGAKGKLNEKEGVFKVQVPRSDLQGTVAGTKLVAPLGITSWAAFQAVGNETMVMGDIVMLEDQVNPVMDVALQAGLEVTGLHNHFFWDNPRIMFMHIGGMGKEDALASAVGKVFAKVKETAGGKGETPSLAVDPSKSSLDAGRIEKIVGRKGEMNAGVYKITIGRATKMHGQPVGNTMGVNTWAAFAGSNDLAMVDGDFAMLESELQGVLKSLRKSGIRIVAIHNHMTFEQPRIMFLHFWGTGKAEDLAAGVKAALQNTAAGN